MSTSAPTTSPSTSTDGLARLRVEGDAEGADRPPGQAAAEHVLAHVGQRAQARRAEVDRRLPAGGRGRPARPEELLAGRDQVVRPGARPARGRGPARGCSRAAGRPAAPSRRRGPAPATPSPRRPCPSAILSVSSASSGWASPSSAARATDLLGEQQLAARRRPQPVGRLEGALVGDREGADLVHLVAEELHPQRVLLGGREDVEDAAADGELAALLDQVHAGVRRVGERRDDVVELDLLAGDELDRHQVGEALDLRLQHRAHRGDDDVAAARSPAPRRGGRAGAARRADGRRCRCGG